jgi:hypothetical protein
MIDEAEAAEEYLFDESVGVGTAEAAICPTAQEATTVPPAFREDVCHCWVNHVVGAVRSVAQNRHRRELMRSLKRSTGYSPVTGAMARHALKDGLKDGLIPIFVKRVVHLPRLTQ